MGDPPLRQKRKPRSRSIITKATQKIFSRPSKDALKVINRKYADALPHVKYRLGIWEQNKARKLQGLPTLSAEGHPVCLTTFGPEKTNIGTRTRLDIWQCLKFLDMSQGTPIKLVDVYLESLCVRANQRLSKLTGVDCHSPNTDPLLYSIPCGYIGKGRHGSNLDRQSKEILLTRRQFWKLRYLLIPMLFRLGDPDTSREYHMVLCAVSLEAKTIDYICSDVDNDDKHGRKISSYIGQTLQELTALSDDFYRNPNQIIIPSEWRMRTEAGEKQTPGSADCGVYAMTHALYLAFGYGINWGKDTFVPGHQDKMLDRRYRIVEELVSHWIYTPKAPTGTKLCEYTVLDTPPTNSTSQGWTPLDSIALSQLSTGVRNRRSCYVGCPDKKALSKHCERNARFYPKYKDVDLNPTKSLLEFREWVERMDAGRRVHNVSCRPLPFPQYEPRTWIDPSGHGKFHPGLW